MTRREQLEEAAEAQLVSVAVTLDSVTIQAPAGFKFAFSETQVRTLFATTDKRAMENLYPALIYDVTQGLIPCEDHTCKFCEGKFHERKV